MKILSREEILALDDRPTEIVEVPEWGGAVKVRGMSVGQRAQLLKRIQGPDGKIDPEKASIVAFIEGVVEPKFTMEDYEALAEKSAEAMDRVTMAFMRLSGVEVGAIEAARKNS